MSGRMRAEGRRRMARAACAVRVTRWVQGPRYHEGEVSTLQQVWAFLEHCGARLRVPGGGTVPPPVQVELRRGRHLSESHFCSRSRESSVRVLVALVAGACVPVRTPVSWLVCSCTCCGLII